MLLQYCLLTEYRNVPKCIIRSVTIYITVRFLTQGLAIKKKRQQDPSPNFVSSQTQLNRSPIDKDHRARKESHTPTWKNHKTRGRIISVKIKTHQERKRMAIERKSTAQLDRGKLKIARTL